MRVSQESICISEKGTKIITVFINENRRLRCERCSVDIDLGIESQRIDQINRRVANIRIQIDSSPSPIGSLLTHLPKSAS
jgi:hypothetical protein